MEDSFDYQAVPFGYAHCFNTHCVKGEKCLRHLVALHSTNKYSTLSVVNPNSIPKDTNDCPFFRPIRKIKIAWGVIHLLDEVPYKDTSFIKERMLNYFGRSLYYRFYRKEHSINPEQQEFIRQLFRQKGITKEPVFEYYTDEYEW